MDGKKVPGPTLTLLMDPASELAGKFTDAVFLRQGGKNARRHEKIYEDLVAALAVHCPTLRLHPYVWDGEDPTDHSALFDFVRSTLPEIRRKLPGREIVVHVSPGTPSMHTVWVLMAETGFIERPFRIVKSVEPSHRHDGRVVVPVEIGIDTFYKHYQVTKPRKIASTEDRVPWDPTKFQSPRLKELFVEARRIAKLKIPVLLLGERGTGKTTLAGWIRASSPYQKPSLDSGWAAVACGQFTSTETMRAELFGYLKGAFTGAAQDREGILHVADKDTLFLDEIGDVSRDVQRLLIKAIEEHAFQRVGSTTTERSDFRLVSATNLPVAELARRLDADFFDRIRACTLRVPSLREIPEELDWLWDDALVQAARRAGVDPRYATLSARERGRLLETLRAHPLPGNMRDLFRVAWRYLAARADDDAPLTQSDALTYALGALEGLDGSGDDQAKAIAKGFLESSPLPLALVERGPVRTEQVFGDIRDYLSRELQRLIRETRRSPEAVADVSSRTLRNWRKGKDPSEDPES